MDCLVIVVILEFVISLKFYLPLLTYNRFNGQRGKWKSSFISSYYFSRRDSLLVNEPSSFSPVYRLLKKSHFLNCAYLENVTGVELVAFFSNREDNRAELGTGIIVQRLVKLFYRAPSEGFKFLIFWAEIVFTKVHIH